MNKSLIVVDGHRIVDRQLAVLRPLFERVVLVTGVADTVLTSDAVGVEVIRDRRPLPGLGPLAGLDAAMAWLPASCSAVVCLAGDMPFLSPQLLIYLRDAQPGDAAAVVPRLPGLADGQAPRPQPLCARYHRSVTPVVEAQLAAGKLAMHRLLAALPPALPNTPIRWVDDWELSRIDPSLSSFTNLNTPQDLVRTSGCISRFR